MPLPVVELLVKVAFFAFGRPYDNESVYPDLFLHGNIHLLVLPFKPSCKFVRVGLMTVSVVFLVTVRLSSSSFLFCRAALEFLEIA